MEKKNALFTWIHSEFGLWKVEFVAVEAGEFLFVLVVVLESIEDVGGCVVGTVKVP